MSAVVEARPAPRARQAKNLKYANDGSYASVEGLLNRLTRMCWNRAEKLGLQMTEGDVKSMMNEGYVRALNKWSPDKGTLFATYCQTVCLNNFNAAIEREIKDITTFGMVSHDDAFGGVPSEDGVDPLEIVGGLDDSCEDLFVAREEVRERLQGLSAGAGRLITALLMSEREAGAGPAPKLRELAAQMGLAGDELRQVKVEILTKFGVRWV